MSNWFQLALILALLGDADVPRVDRLRQPTTVREPFAKDDEIAVLPNLAPADVVRADDDQQAPANAQGKLSNSPMQESSKLELIRYVSGEFAKAIKALPAGKEGFLVYVGQPIGWQFLDRAVATHGAAINTGDKVQITKLEFRPHAIVVDVNGGGRGKKHFLDHLQIGMGGGMPTTSSTTTTQEAGPPGMQPGAGSTIFLEFNKALPDIKPDELKGLLSPLLDFSKERSASVQWIDTLPPELKKAIQERRPAVGMDREEVVAAIGKPEHKVRERDAEGNETEDWIYGEPPDKTIFVQFIGDKVTSIKQYPR
jgi:hypothetical protein